MKFNYTAHKKLWNWLAENADKSKHDWPTQNIPCVCLKLDCEMRDSYVFGIGDAYVGCRHCFAESIVEKESAERWKLKTKTIL